MLNLREDYRKNLIKSLEYIIDRNDDIIVDMDNSDKDYLDFIEVIDFKFHQHGGYCHIVFLCEKYYKVDAFMKVEDAKFILDNIDKIKYVYNIDKMYDTIFGDLIDLFIKYNTNGYRYMKFMTKLNYLFTEDDATMFFKRGKIHNEVINKRVR